MYTEASMMMMMKPTALEKGSRNAQFWYLSHSSILYKADIITTLCYVLQSRTFSPARGVKDSKVKIDKTQTQQFPILQASSLFV